MNSVMVGMFDTRQQADDARSKLIEAGFAASAVTMTDDTPSTLTAPQAQTGRPEEKEEEGAISRFFSSIFGSDDYDSSSEHRTYREAIRRGAFGVSVSASGEAELDRAEQILTRCGAVDVDERSQQWRSEGWSDGDGDVTNSGSTSIATATATASDRQPIGSGDTRKMNVIEEEMKVGKRSVARGGVRVFGRVVEVPVEETVHLREEHVEVERRAADRAATEADFAAFKEGSIEVRETAEEAVVSKDARVVGEVEVGKTVTERDETVRDTVRKTEVEVEKIEPGSATKPGAPAHPGGQKRAR